MQESSELPMNLAVEQKFFRKAVNMKKKKSRTSHDSERLSFQI